MTFIGNKGTDWHYYGFLPSFIIKGNDKFQLELSENKNTFFFTIQVDKFSKFFCGALVKKFCLAHTPFPKQSRVFVYICKYLEVLWISKC